MHVIYYKKKKQKKTFVLINYGTNHQWRRQLEVKTIIN